MWRLESFYAVEKYADLPADDTNPYSFFPLGRLKWRIYDGICQMEGGQYTMDNEGAMLIMFTPRCQKEPDPDHLFPRQVHL